MTFLRVAMLKDLRRILRDPASLGISVLIPLIVGTLIRFVSGGDGGTPTAKLLVADNDASLAGRALVSALGQGQLGDLIHVEAVDEAEGRARMDDGEASGLLIIPEGFSTALLKRDPAVLRLLTNPSQRILPAILEETLRSLADAVNGLQGILENTAGTLLDQLSDVDGVPPDALVAELSLATNRLMKQAEPFLLPPAIRVQVIEAESRPSRSFGEIFFPSMFFLAIIFAAQGLSDDLWKERMQGTLRRNLASPVRLSALLCGKLLAGTLVLGAVSLIALTAGRWVLGIPFQNILLAVVWATVSGLFMLLLFTLIQILAGSQRGGNLLSSGLLFPLIMAGGAFFPFDVMPGWLAAIGRRTPNGLALHRFRELVDGVAEPAAMLVTLAGLLGAGGVLYLLIMARLVRFARG
jgi:ABC-type multidrug transport system permease subunit